MSWRRARSPTAVARRTSRVSVEPRSFNACAPAATAASRSRASARSSSPYTWLVPRSDGCLVSTVKDRPSAAWRRRRSASSGMNRPIASSTSRSSWAGPTLCATWATWRSTYAAASIDRSMVARATRRARHAGRSPLIDPGPDPARGGSGARRPRRGRPCRPRSAARSRRRTRSPRTPRPGGRRVRRPASRSRRGPTRWPPPPGSPPSASPPRPPPPAASRPPRGRRWRSSRPGELEHRGGGVEVGGAPCHALIPAPTTDTQAPKTGFSTGVRETIFEKFSTRRRARQQPGPGEPEPGGVVSTSSTTEGWCGLDRLDHRGLAWSRQARPPGCSVVSTGSTTGLRRGLDRLDHRGWRGLDGLDHRGLAWPVRFPGHDAVVEGLRASGPWVYDGGLPRNMEGAK